MDQIKPVAKLSSLPPWQNYRVNRLSDSIGAIEKLFTMTKFPPVCLLVVQALRPVSGSQWHLFCWHNTWGYCVYDAVVTVFPALCQPPDWLVTTLHTSDGGAGARPGASPGQEIRWPGPGEEETRSHQSWTHGGQWSLTKIDKHHHLHRRSSFVLNLLLNNAIYAGYGAVLLCEAAPQAVHEAVQD